MTLYSVRFKYTCNYFTAFISIEHQYWKAIEKHKINQFYVTPSIITELMRNSEKGFKYNEEYNLTSLKTLATGKILVAIEFSLRNL